MQVHFTRRNLLLGTLVSNAHTSLSQEPDLAHVFHYQVQLDGLQGQIRGKAVSSTIRYCYLVVAT